MCIVPKGYKYFFYILYVQLKNKEILEDIFNKKKQELKNC